MKRIFVTAIIAVILSVFSLSAQDVKTTYVIDGQKVENFDGSQLAGKTIVSYTVRNNTHVVITAEHVGTIRMTDVEKHIGDEIKVRGASKEELVYVIDGVAVSYEMFKNMSTSSIESISVVKSKDSPEFKKYAKTGTKGVLIIQTK